MEGALWVLPCGLQALVMAVDECHFHGRRRLSRREGLGHALDAAAFLACLGPPHFLRPTPAHGALFLVLALLSCALVTKDEFIHQRECPGGEHWCHAVLFLLHPLVLMAAGFLWLCGREPGATARVYALLGWPVPAPEAARWMVRVQGAGALGFLALQPARGLRR